MISSNEHRPPSFAMYRSNRPATHPPIQVPSFSLRTWKGLFNFFFWEKRVKSLLLILLADCPGSSSTMLWAYRTVLTSLLLLFLPFTWWSVPTLTSLLIPSPTTSTTTTTHPRSVPTPWPVPLIEVTTESVVFLTFHWIGPETSLNMVVSPCNDVLQRSDPWRIQLAISRWLRSILKIKA